MLKILHDRLQHYVNWELPNVQAVFRKGRGTRDQIAHIFWILEKTRKFQKNIDLCFIKYTKDFDGVDHNKLWKTLETGLPNQRTCLLRNLYVRLEATVKILHGTTNWFRIENGVWQDCYPVFLLIYTQSISWEMLAWMSYKLDSRLLGEISPSSDKQMIPL